MAQTKKTIHLSLVLKLACAAFFLATFLLPLSAFAAPISSCGQVAPGKNPKESSKNAESTTESAEDLQFCRDTTKGGHETCGSEGNPYNDKKGVPLSIKVGCKESKNPIFAYVQGLVPIIAAGVGIVVVGAIIVGGIMYATARDSENQTQQAKMVIFSATIALIMFLLMAAILNFIIPGGIV